jgi:hypothetical protein
MDFDGCSKTCQVETNYVCTTITVGEPDVCETIYPRPTVVSNTFDELTNIITIEFDQPMLDQNITDEDALLFIETPGIETSFTHNMKFEGKSLSWFVHHSIY